jgi:hypothetical protein
MQVRPSHLTSKEPYTWWVDKGCIIVIRPLLIIFIVTISLLGRLLDKKIVCFAVRAWITSQVVFVKAIAHPMEKISLP